MLKLSHPNISKDAVNAVVAVLCSGKLVQGPECEAFEQELAEYLGCSEVILVSSGTAALHVALLALDIGPGDAVLVPDFTFPATANVVALTGARPVIVDVDFETFTIMPSALEEILVCWKGPERIKAIMPVHEFGCPAKMDAINEIAKKYQLVVVEDAACAIGATFHDQKLGTLGDIGCFSFHPRKILTTGEGGVIVTNRKDLASRMRRLRNHGIDRKEGVVSFVESATNYRMTDFQAALGRHQLPCLDAWICNRRELARCYLKLLAPLECSGLLILPQWNVGHSW